MEISWLLSGDNLVGWGGNFKMYLFFFVAECKLPFGRQIGLVLAYLVYLEIAR